MQPEILAACEKALEKSVIGSDFVRLDAESFEASPDNSIDHRVMEKTKDAAVIALDAGWSDVRSWNALWAISRKTKMAMRIMAMLSISTVQTPTPIAHAL